MVNIKTHPLGRIEPYDDVGFEPPENDSLMAQFGGYFIKL